MKTTPLISCLCLSYKRPSFLQRSIACFRSQSYTNKELIILGHDDDQESKKVVAEFADSNIKFHVVDRLPIGRLRNLSIDLSQGDYFCQWDDDDWYHQKRLQVQMVEMLRKGKQASVLAYWIMFDRHTAKAYLSYPSMWAGTILCDRCIYEEGIRYPTLKKGEDQEFLGRLYSRKCVYPIVDPSLYIYQFHGKNTWGSKHFQELFNKSQPLCDDTSQLIGRILKEDFSPVKASRLLSSARIAHEFDYFHYLKD